MNIRHHVSDTLLAAYATGDLAEGWSLAVATHLSLCPECRQRLKVFEAVAADMMEALPVEDPAVNDVNRSWDAMKARLAGAPSGATGAPVARRGERPSGSPTLPEPLRSYVGADAGGLKWKPLGRGAYQVQVATGDQETQVRLLRIPAGRPVPEHSHGGRELTLVLSGSFSDAQGRFGRGDLEEADEELQHQPIAGPEEDCICLAVTDAPLRFRSRFLRLVQPLLGI